MPSPPTVAELQVDDEVEGGQLIRVLPGTVETSRWRRTERTLLDTFDGRLARKGLWLWREEGPAAPGLTLEGDRFVVGRQAGRRPDRLRGDEITDGPIADSVRPLIAERVLLPRVRIRARSQAWRLRNGDGKTVVRLEFLQPQLVGGGDLRPRISVRSVLGYDRDFRRAIASLSARTAPAPALGEEALRAASLPVRGYSSDVDIVLEATMPAAGATVAICRRLAEVVEVNLPGTAADLDAEFLHDFRVAIRRSRSVLKEMKRVLDAERAPQARADLRWIQEITGPTRDLDVLLEEWSSLTEPVPPSMYPDLAPLRTMLLQDRAAAFAAMRRHLRSRRYALAWRRWRETLEEGPHHGGPDATVPIGRLAGRRILVVHGSMLEMGGAIADDSAPERLHDLRKRGKELRYLLELFGSIWPTDRVKPLVVALKGLQDSLGHFQDDEIQVRKLRSLGPRLAAVPSGTDSLIAAGFVVDGLGRRQQQAREDFKARFADFAGPDQRRLVAETFGRRKR